MSKRVLVAYATKYGQTEKIADRIGAVLRESFDVEVCAVDQLKSDFDPQQYAAFVLGGGVYFGKHPKNLVKFVRSHALALATTPAAFFSVANAAGAPTEEAKQEVKGYLTRFSDASGWIPSVATAFPGSMPYSKYGFFTKWFMRRLAKKRGRDFDTSRDYEYTKWDAVEAFAREFGRTVSAQ